MVIFYLALKNNLGFRGTGFLIGDKYALTAKHCVFHDNEVSSDVEFLLEQLQLVF